MLTGKSILTVPAETVHLAIEEYLNNRLDADAEVYVIGFERDPLAAEETYRIILHPSAPVVFDEPPAQEAAVIANSETVRRAYRFDHGQRVLTKFGDGRILALAVYEGGPAYTVTLDAGGFLPVVPEAQLISIGDPAQQTGG